MTIFMWYGLVRYDVGTNIDSATPICPDFVLRQLLIYTPKDNPEIKIILAQFHNNFTLIIIVFARN